MKKKLHDSKFQNDKKPNDWIIKSENIQQSLIIMDEYITKKYLYLLSIKLYLIAQKHNFRLYIENKFEQNNGKNICNHLIAIKKN